MNLQTQLDIITGFLMPVLVAFITKEHWPDWVKLAVNTALCIVGGTLSAAFAKDWHWTVLMGDKTQWTASILTVLVSSIAFYKHWWDKTGAMNAIHGVTG